MHIVSPNLSVASFDIVVYIINHAPRAIIKDGYYLSLRYIRRRERKGGRFLDFLANTGVTRRAVFRRGDF